MGPGTPGLAGEKEGSREENPRLESRGVVPP